MLYQQCRFDIRNYDTMIWQAIAVIYLVNGVLLTVIINNDFSGWKSICAAAALLVLTFPLTIAFVKHRFFQETRLDQAEEYLRALGVSEVPTTTRQISKVYRVRDLGPVGPFDELLQHWRAYPFVLSTLLLSHVLQLGLLIAALHRTDF